MANNKIQVKRTNTSGRTANVTNVSNTQYIDAGEFALNMADGILYTSNGSALITIGANQVNQNVSNTLTVKAISANGGVGTSGQVLKSNGTSTYWATDNADVGAAGQILYRNSSNVLTTSSGLQYDGTSIKVNGNLESTYQNGDEGGEIFLSKPAAANTSLAGTGVTIDIYQNKIRFFENGGTNRGAYIDITAASTGIGTNLLSGGGGGGSVDVAAQYVWTNLHSFNANVSIFANAIGLSTNTSAIYFAGTSDANWKMGRNTGAFTKWKYTNNSVDIAIANSNLEGFTIGNAINPGNSFFETGYLGTFIASNVTIGNSTVNVTINSTAFSGSANNASFLGGTAAANFVQNTDSRTLSGNLVISGTYFNPSTNTILLGNSTQRWVLSATSGDFSSTVNAVTSVNSALLTVGASFIANTTGAYHTGTINAASVTTTGITVNTSGVYPTSNTSGQGLGTATQRFDAFLDVVDVSGAINTNAGANAIVLSNNTSQFIVFAGGGSAAPTNTTRSPGTKIVIWPAVGASAVDYAIGTDNYVQWYSVGQTIASHVWYANTTNLMVANTTGLYHIGTVNAASHTVGTSFTANSTVVNAVSYYAGTLLVANTTVVNATHLSGKTEGNLNVNNALTANNADYVKANSGITSNASGVFVTEGSGLSVNSTGVHVQANNGIVSNSTGTFAKAANGVSVDSSGINVLAGNTQLISNSTGVWANQANFDHNSLSNYDANKHIDHTSVSITAGSGLTGGGTIAASRTIDVGAGNGISVAADAVYVNGGSTLTVNTLGAHVNSTLSLTTLTTTGNATIGGNLTINGNVTVIGANNLSIVDNMIYLNSNSTTSNVDLGFAGNYNDGTYKHAGFFRDASDGYWKPFDGYTPEPDAAVDIDTSNNTFNIAGMWFGNTRIGNTTVYATVNSTVYSGTANNSTNFGGYTWAAPGLLGSSTANGASFTYANVTGQVNTATFYATTSANVGANVQLTTSVVSVGNSTVNIQHTATTLLAQTNTTVNASMTASALQVSNSTGNVQHTATTLLAQTNTTVNASMTASLIRIANSTGGANVTPTTIVVGNSTVQTSVTIATASFGGNVGINTTNTTAYTLNVNGSFAATTKSFVINHPTKSDMKLRYGSLEGPENGIYVRGKLEGSSIIELPDYWWSLIDQDTITVNLTPYGRSQDIWVQSTSAYFIHLNQPADCFFTVFAERKDVDKLVVEY